MQPNQVIQPTQTPQQPEVPQELTTSNTPLQSPPPSSQPKKIKKKVLIIFGAILLVVIIMTGAYVAFGPSDKSTNKQATPTNISKTLLDNKGIDVSLPVSYAPFKTISTGFYPKWIEAHMKHGVLKVVVSFKQLPEPKKIQIKNK